MKFTLASLVLVASTVLAQGNTGCPYKKCTGQSDCAPGGQLGVDCINGFCQPVVAGSFSKFPSTIPGCGMNQTTTSIRHSTRSSNATTTSSHSTRSSNAITTSFKTSKVCPICITTVVPCPVCPGSTTTTVITPLIITSLQSVTTVSNGHTVVVTSQVIVTSTPLIAAVSQSAAAGVSQVSATSGAQSTGVTQVSTSGAPTSFGTGTFIVACALALYVL